MPWSAPHVCSRCGIAHRGPCLGQARKYDQQRGSASSRGYGTAWKIFRQQFIGLLLEQGQIPLCGAIVQGGPETTDSHCAIHGRFTSSQLELDHEPPLQDWERHHLEIVCDPRRVQFLCRSCHSRKSNRERQVLTQV